MTKKVWEAFHRDPEETAFESEEAFAKIMAQELREEPEVRWEDVNGLDRIATTKVRVNQHFFRSIVIAGYGGKCAVCKLPLTELLVASHIVPWSVDQSERMNPQNGICLCAIHDRAFDKGLLLIGVDFQISLSDSVWQEDGKPVQDFLLQFDGRLINLPDRWHPAPQFLLRHQELVRAAYPAR